MSTANLWGQLKLGANAGVLAGGYPYAGTFRYVGAGKPSFTTGYNTIADALAAMVSKDVLLLGPQGFTETGLVVPVGLDNITIMGMGNRGSCFIEPSGAAEESMNILGDDCTIINVGFAGGATADYALKVGSTTVSPARTRLIGCKIEGPETTQPALLLHGVGDLIIDDCEFAWCGTGIRFQSNDNGFCTQVRILNSLFQNFTAAGIDHAAAAQQVNNFWLQGCFFDRQEDGSTPTDFILLSDNLNTGFIAGNFFANPTNEAAVITIGTGILYGPNGTEAGWSTARPA